MLNGTESTYVCIDFLTFNCAFKPLVKLPVIVQKKFHENELRSFP